MKCCLNTNNDYLCKWRRKCNNARKQVILFDRVIGQMRAETWGGKIAPPLSGMSFCCKSQFCRVQARQIGPWMQSVWHVGDTVSHWLSCFVVFDQRRAAEPVKMAVSLYAWRWYENDSIFPVPVMGAFAWRRRYPAAAGWGRFEPTVLNLIIKNNTNLNVYAYE